MDSDDNRTESFNAAISAETAIIGRPFVKGQSGNPSGRPQTKPLTDALRKVFSPEECLAVAMVMLRKARQGSMPHITEIINRLEGKVTDTDESRGNITFNVVISAPRPTKQLNGD
jgi:hypothetical protein